MYENTWTQQGWNQAFLNPSLTFNLYYTLLPQNPLPTQSLTFWRASMWTASILGEDFCSRNVFATSCSRTPIPRVLSFTLYSRFSKSARFKSSLGFFCQAVLRIAYINWTLTHWQITQAVSLEQRTQAATQMKKKLLLSDWWTTNDLLSNKYYYIHEFL